MAARFSASGASQHGGSERVRGVRCGSGDAVGSSPSGPSARSGCTRTGRRGAPAESESTPAAQGAAHDPSRPGPAGARSRPRRVIHRLCQGTGHRSRPAQGAVHHFSSRGQHPAAAGASPLHDADTASRGGGARTVPGPSPPPTERLVLAPGVVLEGRYVIERAMGNEDSGTFYVGHLSNLKNKRVAIEV